MERTPTCTGGKKRMTVTKPVSGLNWTVFASIMTLHSFQTLQHFWRATCVWVAVCDREPLKHHFFKVLQTVVFGRSASKLHLCFFSPVSPLSTPQIHQNPRRPDGRPGWSGLFCVPGRRWPTAQDRLEQKRQKSQQPEIRGTWKLCIFAFGGWFIVLLLIMIFWKFPVRVWNTDNKSFPPEKNWILISALRTSRE